MICATCGGNVEWKGPIANLTHTECGQCGAINNQEVESSGPYTCRSCSAGTWNDSDVCDDCEAEGTFSLGVLYRSNEPDQPA